MAFRSLEDTDLAGKRALVRVDFNVPMENGKVADDTRLRAALPTIHYLSSRGAKVVLLAHFDRPKGKRVAEMSLRPVVEPLSKLLEQPVAFADDCIGPDAGNTINGLEPGGVALLENLRFHAGEEDNDPAFIDALAANGDIFVGDAFSAAHRAHASTEGLARHLPAYPGLSMQLELEALDKALGNPERPVMGIVGGSKVSSKLDLLKNLVTKPSSMRRATTSAPPIAKRTWPRPPARSSAWPAATSASCSCRWTSSSPTGWARASPPASGALAKLTMTSASSTPAPKPSPA